MQFMYTTTGSGMKIKIKQRSIHRAVFILYAPIRFRISDKKHSVVVTDEYPVATNLLIFFNQFVVFEPQRCQRWSSVRKTFELHSISSWLSNKPFAHFPNQRVRPNWRACKSIKNARANISVIENWCVFLRTLFHPACRPTAFDLTETFTVYGNSKAHAKFIGTGE